MINQAAPNQCHYNTLAPLAGDPRFLSNKFINAPLIANVVFPNSSVHASV